MPDIRFINSPKTEEERLAMTARIIAAGFYEKQGFVVVPELSSQVSRAIQVVYPNQPRYQEIKTQKWVRGWEKVAQDYWRYLAELLPSARLHGEIEVRVSRYGTVSSSGKLGMIPGVKTIYYLRWDVGLAELAAMIVNNILQYDRKLLGVTWTKREALMDFIMTRPKMKKLFPDYIPVFSQLSRVPKKVREESKRYTNSLGLSKQKREFEIVSGKVVVRGKLIGKELTKLEKVVLKQLIERMGDLVTYDELADLVWGEGEFKTFWALNKVVERLRHKLVELGVEGSRLESVRGQGYVLM